MKRSHAALVGGMIVLALLGLVFLDWYDRGPPPAHRDLPRQDDVDLDPLPPGPRLEGLERVETEPIEAETLPAEAPPGTVGTSYVVEGRVLDAVSRKAVPFARILGGWERRDPDTGAWGRREYEASADADGRFRLEVSEDDPEHAGLSWRVGGDEWRVLRWHVQGEEKNFRVDVQPGALTRVVLWVGRAFRLQGRVVDPEGTGLPGVTLTFAVPNRRPWGLQIASGYAHTDEDGHFDLGPLDERPLEDGTDAQRKMFARESLVTVQRKGYATHRFDPRALAPIERDRVTITLSPGLVLAGTLVDDMGRPIPDAVVAVEYGGNYELRRGTRTDGDGRWRLETVTPGAATLRVRAFAHDAKLTKEMTLEEDDLDLRLVAETIRLSAPPRTTRVLGLELVQVDDEIRAAYDVPKYVHVLMFHPGEDPEALGIGRLEKGFGLWHVGDKELKTVGEAIDLLIDLREKEQGFSPGVRVVYTFWNESLSGTNTQYVKITDEQLEALKAQ